VPPSAYEWNLQHRGGRYEKVPNESVVTCGDQALLDINAVVQYRTCDPAKRLFRARDPERLLAVAAEGALREVVARTALIHLLTERRRETEAAAEARLAAILATYDVGIGVVGVRLQDVHPPLEVVDAFRRVVDGLEQKEAKINQAQAYASEEVTLARGTAVTVREAAAAEAAAVVARSTGEAGRFVRLSEARTCGPAAPAVTDVQLHCEALEAALANARLTVLDPGVPGPRGLVLLDPAAQRRGTGIAVTPLTDPEGRASESPSAGDRPGTEGGPIPR
jgi:regulator of protease activity HflC (stomatin/prohibitin superfamily)